MLFVILDTETTGIDKEMSRPLEISYLLVDEKLNIHSSGSHYLWDRRVMIGSSSNVHHLTPDFLEEHAEDPALVCDELYPVLYRANLICHNVDFDSAILRNEFSRYGYDLNFNNCFCTMKATTNACKLPSKGGKRGYKYPKLEELLEHYKVPDVFVRASYNKNFPNKEAPAEAQYHNAAYDVCATHMVLGMGAYEDVKRYYGNSWFSAGTGA